jgi:hypothetical protein
MKKLMAKETQRLNFQGDIESTKEWINQTLRKIHRKMVELFSIDFTYFRDVKIIKQPELLKQLAKHMWIDLKESGVVYSNNHMKQIFDNLSKNQVEGFFENFAFYNTKDEILYINENVITNYPERVIPICTHELSEKLLSTYLSTSLKAPTQVLIKKYSEARRTSNIKRFCEYLDMYKDTVFKSVFKEGCCEAIALRTLRNTEYGLETASLEKELLIGHLKCIKLLFALESKGSTERTKKAEMHMQREGYQSQEINTENLVKELFKDSQIIKGLSYYLGYPLAKAVLEKYWIEGVKNALEKSPPLEARYFATPEDYLALLEELQAASEKRR